MTLKNLIIILEVKEKEALAYTGFLSKKLDNDKLDVEELQKLVDNFCNNIAVNFIETYSLQKDESLRNNMFKYLYSVGANKPHSGKRVSEALYKKLSVLQNELVK